MPSGATRRFGSGGSTTVFRVAKLSSLSVSLMALVESARAVPVTVAANGNVYSIVTTVDAPGARPPTTVVVSGLANA